MKFEITRHAVIRWHEKFSDYVLKIPLWKALELAQPANESMQVRLEIQALRNTTDPRRTDIKTYFFLYKNVVFVCQRENINKYVVVTCWELEDEPKGKTFSEAIEDYIESNEKFKLDKLIEIADKYKKWNMEHVFRCFKGYNGLVNKTRFIKLWDIMLKPGQNLNKDELIQDIALLLSNKISKQQKKKNEESLKNYYIGLS